MDSVLAGSSLEEMDTTSAPETKSWAQQVEEEEARSALAPSSAPETKSWAQQVEEEELRYALAPPPEAVEDDEEQSARVPRAPCLLHKPTNDACARFLRGPYTRKVLYPGRYDGDSPAEGVEYLADHITGKPQHSYVLSKTLAYGGTTNPTWLAQSSRTAPVNRDDHPPTRWSAVSHVASMTGHTAFPQLHP